MITKKIIICVGSETDEKRICLEKNSFSAMYFYDLRNKTIAIYKDIYNDNL